MCRSQHRCGFVPRMLGLLAAAFVVGDVCAQTAAWFGGGGYDGYDRSDTQQAMGLPYANNANGATNVLPYSAWLNGMLVSKCASATAVKVYWGPMDGETNKWAWANTNDFGFQEKLLLLTTPIIGLTPKTTYYYRFYATNMAGAESWAFASATFLTLSTPAVTNTGATAVGLYTATLNGNFTAGSSATITLYWGTNASAWGASANLGIRTEGAFSNAITGLTDSTLYYYRCHASNVFGDAWSDIAVFPTFSVLPCFVGGSYDGYDNSQPMSTAWFVESGTIISIY